MRFSSWLRSLQRRYDYSSTLPSTWVGRKSANRLSVELLEDRTLLSSGLVGYWPFDGNGNDGSGSGLNLGFYGGVGFASGLLGQALDLHANNSQYAARPVSDPAFDFQASDFTVQVWVNFNSHNRQQTLIEKFSGAGGPGWTLTTLYPQKEYQFYSNATGGAINSPAIITTGVWHDVIARRIGSTLDLFVDDVLVASGAASGAINSSSNPLLVGRRDAADGRDFSVDGRLDEVAIWDRGLTDSDIAQLWNSGSGTPANNLGNASPTITTAVTIPEEAVGTAPLQDAATLSGGNNETGTVAFTLYNSATVQNATTQVYSETVAANGNNTVGTNVGWVPTGAGTYYWVASYSGDGNNNPVASGSSDEPEIVDKASPKIGTMASPGGIVATLYDTANLSGGYNETGSINFTLYNSANVSVFTDTELAAGNAAVQSAGFRPTAIDTYHWSATYVGDGNNNGPVSDNGTNESVTVTGIKAIPSLSTVPGPAVVLGSAVKLTDSATLSGGNRETGSLTFMLFASNGGVVNTEVVTVNGDGTYATPGYLAPSSAALGAYGWQVSYGGDANNIEVTSPYMDPNGNIVESEALVSVSTGTPANTSFWGTTNGQSALQNNDSSTAVSEVQAVYVGMNGWYTLTFNGKTTSVLPWNASADWMQNELNSLPTIGGVGGSVTVTLSNNVYTVTFGGSLGFQRLPLLVASNSNAFVARLSGGQPAAWRTLLNGLNLRDATGALFTVSLSASFASAYAAFATWLGGATSTNQAYMLSAQLAVMDLNNLLEGVDPNESLFIGPSSPINYPANAAINPWWNNTTTGTLSDTNSVMGNVDAGAAAFGLTGAADTGFITIAQVEANVINMLQTYGNPLAGSNAALFEQALQIALAGANTNLAIFALVVQSQFGVATPSSSTAGTSFSITITALDTNGGTATGYTGTVHFTSSDVTAVLPADYTFTSADAGVHTFSVALKTAGSQSITVTDTSNNGITGSQSGITVDPAAASQLVTQTQPSATAIAGQAFAVQPAIEEEDPFGNLETGDSTTQVIVSLNSGVGPLQGTTAVTVSGGVATFTNLADNKAETIALNFSATSLTEATSNPIIIGPAATSNFVVSGFPSPAVAGVTGAFTVTAQDAFGNTTPAYRGAVTFTSSDATAALPATYTFTSANAGAHTFSATLKTAGSQSITATDTSNSSISGSQSGITVNLPSDDGLFVSGTYHDVLGRAADAQGLANNLDAIDAARFALLPSYANRFLFSGEYFSNLVKGWYQKYLSRAADPGGLAGNVAALQGGAADEQVIAILVGSGEFFTKNGGSNLSFLQAAYLNILGRALDSSGQTVFLGLLAAGVSRATVAMDLLSSGEYRTKLVAGYYSTFLGRTGSSADIAAWAGNLASGMRDEIVISYFVSSWEYFQNPALGGDSNQLWLTSLYQKVLNRAPYAAGLTFNLSGLLNAYAAQRQIESARLLGSNEYRSNLVNGWYQKYLGRAADPGGLAGNVAALAAGTPDEQIIANLVGSGEYFANHKSTNLGFLQAAYSDILGRALDAVGQAAFLNELASGVSRTTVALQLLSSTEYRTNLVGGFYTKLLGRSGSSAEVAGWVAVIAAGETDEQVINTFLTTGEYFLRTHP